MSKRNEKICYNGLFKMETDMGVLIKAQSNTPAFDKPVEKQKQKVNTQKVKTKTFRKQNKN